MKTQTETTTVRNGRDRSPAAPATYPATVALDIGYGYTKIYNGERLASFPSAVGYPENIRYTADELTGVTPAQGLRLITPQGERFVGELAILQSRLYWTPLGRERTGDATMTTLALAAFAELNLTGIINLVTGLPVDWYNDRHALISQLTGNHTVHRADGDAVTVTVNNVLVLPQPFGSLFAAILDETGKLTNPDLASARVGVIDIGVGTTDIVVADKLHYIEPGSGSTNAAMSRVCELVGRALQEQYSADLPLHRIDQAIRRGKITVRGQTHNIAAIVEPIAQGVAEKIKTTAANLWRSELEPDVVIVTGGGASLIGPYLADRYPQLSIAVNAGTANARGYYRYGLRKWSAANANK